ncbi:MAG: hypothetical protein LBO71_07395 [Prevotellaceae bacterium]|jgi:Skp family chaperone for outer membrane proteins|nr:hypothetical protein [Prevotellaceae bacterium]
MKKKLFTFSLLLGAVTLFAQQKTLEASGKKPDWAKQLVETGYIITQGDALSLGDAQQEALLLVKQEIVRSVAEQVISASTHSLQEQGMNVTESYTQSITAKANKVPFLQGISISKVEDSYWEKLRDKSSKKELYRYYIKYPFGAAQLGKLVAEFREEDQKITQRLSELESLLAQVESVEQMEAAVDELGNQIATLEDNRKDRAATLQSRYRALYESILVVEVGHTPGQISYKLALGERPLKTSRKPQVKSDCATITQTTIGDICSISYRYDGCYADVENFVNVQYRFGHKNVQHKFLIPLN